MVLTDDALGSSWRAELAGMCERINVVRALLDEPQVIRLREEHSVYMVNSSRVNVAGINASNVDYVAAAVADVMRG